MIYPVDQQYRIGLEEMVPRPHTFTIVHAAAAYPTLALAEGDKQANAEFKVRDLELNSKED